MKKDYGFLQLFSDTDVPAPVTETTAPQTTASATEPAAPVAGGQTATTTTQVDPNWTPEKDAAFAKRLESERSKIRAQAEADFRKQNDSDLRLAQMLRQQGHDPAQVLSQFEQQQIAAQAQQAGLNPAVYQQMLQMQQQMGALTQDRRISELRQEATSLQTEFGGVFDQHAQAAIDRAAATGESLEEAFFAVGRRDILKAQNAASEQKVLAQVTGRDGKAPVNTGGGPQVTPQNDINSMSKEEFQKLTKEVKAGRRTSL